MARHKDRPQFEGGRNIALKVPRHEFDRTVAFYRDVLGLPVIGEEGASVTFRFGANRLWVDRVDHLSRAEVWLELATDDSAAAARYLDAQGIQRRDEIESLPEGFDGFWVCNPANVIHLVARSE
jgi:catechol 2,3-dioxygenase-like lactoylglutathione lyase family enzyme